MHLTLEKMHGIVVRSSSILLIQNHASRSKTLRFVSQGALAGGFTKEALHKWSNHHLNDPSPNKSYVDLFSQTISHECIQYLDEQKHPSNELILSFFGSNHFTVERTMLSPFLSATKMPPVFTIDQQYLAWKVVVNSPLEIICEWELGNNRDLIGCTMIAFDPKLRRVYHGNCVHSSVAENKLFKAFVPIHTRYANFLLKGMVDDIERKCKLEREAP